MKTYTFLFFLFGALSIGACGIISDTDSTEIILDDYTVSIEYETANFGDTDRIADLYEGRTLKIGNEKPPVFTSDTNLLSGSGYVYGGAHTMWLRRGLKDTDHWYLLFNRNTESTEYNQDYNDTILPLRYSKNPATVEELSINLTGSGEEGTLAIMWGVHRFEMDLELPPSRN